MQELKGICTVAHSFLLREVTEVLPVNAAMGEQIAYYRKIKGLRQEDLADEVGISRHTVSTIEEKGDDYYNIEILKKIFDFLEISDKVVLTDYLKFLLRAPPIEIKQVRKDKHLTQIEFAKLMRVRESTVKSWENGKISISKKCYERMNELCQSHIPKSGITFYPTLHRIRKLKEHIANGECCGKAI